MSKAEFGKGEQMFQSQVNRRVTTGMMLVILGTVCFAAKAIFIKLAYEKGASPEATLFARQLIATPLFWILFLINRPKIPAIRQRGDSVKACFAGLLSFFLSPLLDFIGLHHVSAIVERMLLISYPVFVMILSAFMQKRMISIQNLIAIVVIYAGIYLSIGGWNTGLLKANLTGAIFILLSSVVYAGYLVLSSQLVHKIGGIRMNAYGMASASLAMVVYLVIKSVSGNSMNLFRYSLSVYELYFVIAVVSTVVSFVLILEGIKRIGAERASILSMLGPVITILLGTLFLGERLELVQWAGCFLVFLTVAVLELQKFRGRMYKKSND
ncbi:DMT family transporter [Fodinisporobacter ferrooxydans]|uniref:DMT family transporter n=1 Tax=Fodinisporobacter ferrooxydans TaxID=2901836 RepID=A0ABY4CI95_9BACL|nr:DMT family transporter [Alicyclobacillaceae bacterium MYW30-H2]